MTIAEMKFAKLGKSYWGEYVRVNGYAFNPTQSGIAKLSRLLDMTPSHVRQCINSYLSA